MLYFISPEIETVNLTTAVNTIAQTNDKKLCNEIKGVVRIHIVNIRLPCTLV